MFFNISNDFSWILYLPFSMGISSTGPIMADAAFQDEMHSCGGTQYIPSCSVSRNTETLARASALDFNLKLVISFPSLVDSITSIRPIWNIFLHFRDTLKATNPKRTTLCCESNGAFPGRYFEAKCRFCRHLAIYSLGRRSLIAREM